MKARAAPTFVAIVSPGSGEGRSQLSAELAIAFAQLGRPHVAGRCRFAQSAAARIFRRHQRTRIDEGHQELEKPIYHPVLGLPQMHLLTAGPTPSNPLELLSRRALRETGYGMAQRLRVLGS